MPEYNTIQSILDNHIKLPLYLTGISGDLETGSQIKINQGLLKNQTTSGPFMITEMVDGIPPGSDLEVKIYYTFNDNDYKIVKMHNTADQPNIYTGKIPKQKSAGVIRYFISVENEDIMVTLPESNDEFEFNIKGPSDDLTWPLGLFLIAIIIIIVVLIAVILKTIRRKNY